MHELSIAQSIHDLVMEQVPTEDRNAVRCVRVRVGESSGVIADSLTFCFSVITRESVLNNAVLEIESVPYSLYCSQCDSTRPNNAGTIVCPVCGGTDTRIVSGTELLVSSIEVEDHSPEAP